MKKMLLVSLLSLTIFLSIPSNSHAQPICFDVADFTDVFMMELVQAGGFIHIVGVDVGACGNGTSAPLTGSGHVIGSEFHFSLVVSPVRNNFCFPFHVEGRIDINSLIGTGELYNVVFGDRENATTIPLSLFGVPCPVIPESVDRALGEGRSAGKLTE